MNGDRRSEVLIQAIPYIQRFAGETVVIKYGGHAMVDQALMEDVMKDLVLLQLVGIRIIVVHGGGPFITEALQKMGKEPVFVDGLRVTDEETMKIVQMVLAGEVNKKLVQNIEQLGGRAIGLCGIDGNMLVAEKLQQEKDLGLVGRITEVNHDLPVDSMDKGYICVIASVANSRERNVVYNINADIAAAEIARSVGAMKLILMTDVLGVMKDPQDPSTLLQQIRAEDIPQLKETGVITGGMIPKLDCCTSAIQSGVQQAHIIDGTKKHSLLIELLTDEGIGTMIY
ncbi:MAG: acetylglutamate kinase [Tissierellia bacterium]|nr:acetylglutamate kinase [Bacillota bacterium]NLK58492.1 acetylglutamate kinase [Tissierellia bacterium]